jgi:hypothetical protein
LTNKLIYHQSVRMWGKADAYVAHCYICLTLIISYSLLQQHRMNGASVFGSARGIALGDGAPAMHIQIWIATRDDNEFMKWAIQTWTGIFQC